jgi:hypothetical protein
MQVILKKALKIGNRNYAKGPQELPDSLAYNVAFKKLVVSGDIALVPRSERHVKIRLQKDIQSHKKAQDHRKGMTREQLRGQASVASVKEFQAQKLAQSAKSVPGAHSHIPGALGSVQILPTPAKPIQAGVAAQASAPAAPATAQEGSE